MFEIKPNPNKLYDTLTLYDDVRNKGMVVTQVQENHGS